MISPLLLAILLLCACGFLPSSAFTPSFLKTSKSCFRVYGIGDFLSKALANEALPPPKNPGLSNGPSPIEVEFLPANKVVKAYLGQKIPDIAKANGITIRYSCKKALPGDCGTCEVNFNGKVVKACQSSLPATSSLKRFQIAVLDNKKK